MSVQSTAQRLSITVILAVHAAFAAGCATSDPREQASSPAAPPAAAVVSQNATATAATEPKTAAPAAADGSQIRCVYQPVTGSRVRQKTCRTEAEWKQLTLEGQQAVRELQKPIAQGVEGG